MDTVLWIIKPKGEEPYLTHVAPDPLPPQGTFPEAIIPDGMPYSLVLEQVALLRDQLYRWDAQNPGEAIAAKLTISQSAGAVNLVRV